MREVENISTDEMDKLVSDYKARQRALSVVLERFQQEHPHLFSSSMVTRDTVSVVMDHMNRMAPGIEFSEFIALMNPLAMSDNEEWSRMLREVGNLWVNSKFTLNPKVYEITSGLLDQLVHTEIRGVKQTELKLPFTAVKIMLPVDFFPKFKSIILYEHAFVNLGSDGVFCRPSIAMLLSLRSEEAEILLNNTLNEELDIYETKSQHIYKHDEAEDLGAHNIPHLFMNVIMYMTSQDVRRKTITTNPEYNALTRRLEKARGAKREEIKSRRRSLDPGYRIVLGIGVPCISVDNQGGVLTVRTLVSGFWRNQVFGPAKDADGTWIAGKEREHRKLWIQPFWRGPELAPETNPIRVMRNLDESGHAPTVITR